MGLDPGRIVRFREGARCLGNASPALIAQVGEAAIVPATAFQLILEFRYLSPPGRLVGLANTALLRCSRNNKIIVGDCISIGVARRIDALPRLTSQNPRSGEFSRRARGFASYAALRELGRNGVRELVERCCDCAAQLVAGLGELEGVEVLSNPIINQGLVAFSDLSGALSNEWNDEVIAEIAAEGTSFFSGTTTWNGRRAMRISVSNWQTSHEDVIKTVASVERVLTRMRHLEPLEKR